MIREINPRILSSHPLIRLSFSKAYRLFALPLTKFIVSRLHGDQQAVEEVFAATVEAAWKGHQTFRFKSNYYTWLCRIALNKIADYYRTKINQGSFVIAPLLDNLADMQSLDPTPEEQLALLELKSALLDCLNLLPPQTKHLLTLRYWKDQTIAEIAATTGLPPRAVEGKLYRAKKSFRKLFASHYPQLAPQFLPSLSAKDPDRS